MDTTRQGSMVHLMLRPFNNGAVLRINLYCEPPATYIDPASQQGDVAIRSQCRASPPEPLRPLRPTGLQLNLGVEEFNIRLVETVLLNRDRRFRLLAHSDRQFCVGSNGFDE